MRGQAMTARLPAALDKTSTRNLVPGYVGTRSRLGVRRRSRGVDGIVAASAVVVLLEMSTVEWSLPQALVHAIMYRTQPKSMIHGGLGRRNGRCKCELTRETRNAWRMSRVQMSCAPRQDEL
jgi:hypothetical protein